MKGMYAGSFDPPTNGHLWMIKQGIRLFDPFVIAVGRNSHKEYTFSLDERVEMLKELTLDSPNVEIVKIENKFLVRYAEEAGVQFILRGIRNEGDYAYERGMRYVNGTINNSIITIFMMSPRHLVEVSSSLVKSLVGIDTWENITREYVPPTVHKRLLNRFPGPQPEE